jgi:hypothetical protein
MSALPFADRILDVLYGQRPPRIVNPAMWLEYARWFEQLPGFQLKNNQRLQNCEHCEHR